MSSPTTLSSEDGDLLHRLHRYYEWVESYKTVILPDCAIAFRLRVPTLRIHASPAFRADALLPVLQMLRHDSCIHTLDLTGLPLCDSGAYVVADGVAGGAPLRELNLEGCGIGAAGAIAIFRAAERNLHLRRLSLAHNAIGPPASGALAQLLKRTRFLAEVDVRGCSLGTAGLRELTAALLERASAREQRRMVRGAAALPAPPSPDSVNIARGSACARFMGVVTRDDRLVVTTAFRVKLLGAQEGLWAGMGALGGAGEAGGGRGGGAGSGALAVGGGGGGGGGARSRAGTSSSALDGDVEDTLDLSVLIGSNLIRLEVVSSVIHAVGLVLTVFGAFPLIDKGRRADAGPAELLSYVIYLSGLLGWFSTALLRHSLFQLGSTVLARLTPPAAFVLIASTYTPFLLNSFSCVHGAWLVLSALWALAVLGSAAASALPTLTGGRLLLILYLLEGYSGAALGALLPTCLSPAAWRLLFSGGACFSAGVLFYWRGRPPGGLAPTLPLWYAFVLTGAALHFFAVLWYVEAPSQRCFEAAAHLGLAAGPEPGDWEGVQAARQALVNASTRLTLAGRQAVAETLRELLKNIEGAEL
jgi:hemolysin III